MSTGNATLDWTPPTENTDGSVLTNLAGYNVRYGTSADNLTQVDKLTNPGLTSYVVDKLSTGTWYFAISSYAANGVDIARCVAPAEHHQALFTDDALQNAFRYQAFVTLHRKEDHAHAVFARSR